MRERRSNGELLCWWCCCCSGSSCSDPFLFKSTDSSIVSLERLLAFSNRDNGLLLESLDIFDSIVGDGQDLSKVDSVVTDDGLQLLNLNQEFDHT